MDINGINLKNERLQRYEVEALRVSRNHHRLSNQDVDQSEQSQVSPLGELLRSISLIPEIREDKVEQLRAQIKDGSYDFDGHIDVVLDRVLEDILG